MTENITDRELIRRLIDMFEWSREVDLFEYGRLIDTCPICHGHKNDGHEDWCDLAALKKEAAID